MNRVQHDTVVITDAVFNEQDIRGNGAMPSAGPGLSGVSEDVARLANLESDWNDEGAPIIDRGAILRVRKFVQWLAGKAAEQTASGDCAPEVFPTINGGIRLYWKTRGHQVSLVFHPDRDTVEVIERSRRTQTVRRQILEDEAVSIGISAMREAH
jgi:hypothetical protein